MAGSVVEKGVNDLFKSYLITNLVNNSSLYFIFGGTAPWPDEVPPIVTGKEKFSDLSAPLVWVKVSTAAGAIQTTCAYTNNPSSIIVDDLPWTLIPLDRILSSPELPTNLYLSVTVGSDEIPSPVIRYMGIVAGTTFQPGVNPNLLTFSPSDIANPGSLIYLANFTPLAVGDCGVTLTKFGVIINI